MNGLQEKKKGQKSVLGAKVITGINLLNIKIKRWKMKIENKTASPVQITEDIQISLNRLGRDLETHAESGIRIGKELLHLKEITPHGQFGALVEWAYGLKETMRRNYINVAHKFGQNRTWVRFSNKVLIELSRPSVPDSAREEATEHESLTVKQSKELAKANKRIEELQTECERLNPEPNLENLIPEILTLYKGGSVVLARAKQLSTLDHKYQEIYLQEFHLAEFHRKIADQAKIKAEKAMEKALKAIEEKEIALAKLDEASGTTEAELMLKYEKDLKALREEALEQAEIIKKKAEEEAFLRNKEKITNAQKGELRAIKDKKEAQAKANAAYKGQNELELKIKKLEEQLKVNNPTNVDLAMEKQIQMVSDSVVFVLKQLEDDMLKIGGGMERSIKAVRVMEEEIANKLKELEDDSKKIIEIGG